MSVNNLLEKSLIELEENLKLLDSARRQVDSMAGDTERLINAIIRLIREIEKIRTLFADSRQEIAKEISVASESIRSSVIFHSDNYQNEISTLLSFNKESSTNVLSSISSLNNNLSLKINGLLEDIKKQKQLWLQDVSKINTQFTIALQNDFALSNDQVKNRLKLFCEDLDATLQMSSIKMLEFNETIEKAKRDVNNFITEINNAELSQRIDALNTKIIEMSDYSILSFNDHKKRINDGFVEISRNVNNKIRILILMIFFLFMYIILVDHVF